MGNRFRPVDRDHVCRDHLAARPLNKAALLGGFSFRRIDHEKLT